MAPKVRRNACIYEGTFSGLLQKWKRNWRGRAVSRLWDVDPLPWVGVERVGWSCQAWGAGKAGMIQSKPCLESVGLDILLLD